MKLWHWVVAGVVGLGLLSTLGLYAYTASLRTTGVELESGLTATYEDNQNQLSSYISGFYEQLGVANLKSAKLDTILTNAVQGRYGDEGFRPNGAVVSALTEAYPDLKGLDVYDRILTHIQGGREAFKGRQSQLLDQLRVYDTWRRSGLIRPMFVRFLGFPAEDLEARVGGKVVARGALALEQFRKLVLVGQAAEAFGTGRMAPLAP